MELNRNSFIENVNYLASLDNNYGSAAKFVKNNLSLISSEYNILLRVRYFVHSEMKIKEIVHQRNKFIFQDLNSILNDFKLKVNEVPELICTYTLVGNNVTIDIKSNDNKTKVCELAFIVNQYSNELNVYNLRGTIIDPLNILPTLALFDEDVINGTVAIGNNIESIITVSNNIDSVIIDAENIDSIVSVGNNIENVTNVSNNISNVNNVAYNYTNINTVSTNITDVNKVATNEANINTVSNNISNVNKVAVNINDVNTVATNIDSVVVVKDNIDDIKNVNDNIGSILDLDMTAVKNVSNNMDSVVIDANNIGNINIVADDLSEVGFSNLIDMGSISDPVEQDPTGISLIETVAVNITDVKTNANNIASIKTNSDNIVDINKVADNIDNIKLTGTSIDNINIVAPKIDKVDTVANNITNVNNVADNIVDIQNAEENAQIAIDKAAKALASEEKAQKWADYPEDKIVQGTFGIDDKYSAYHWAKKAEAAAGGNIALKSLYDVNVDNVVNGGTIVYNSTTLLWEAYDFARNTKLGFNLNPGTSVEEGQLGWNVNEGTLDLGLANGVVLQIGQENVRNVRNDSGSTIEDGTVVMSDGTIGNSGRVKVKPFTGLFNQAHLIYGVATHDIANGTDGIITIDGKVRGIDTTGTSVGEVWSDGDLLYAKPEGNGTMTKIVPADDKLKIIVARVIKAHTSGTLEIGFMKFNENMYYTKVQNDILLANKVPLTGDFILDLGDIV